MHLKVHGKQVDVGESLRQQTEGRVVSLVEKHFPTDWSGTVTFAREAGDFRCDVNLHLSSGMHLQASAAANGGYAALEICANRLEKRLRRYMRRLKDHHTLRQEPIEILAAQAYVIEKGPQDDEPEPVSLDPVIVAEMQAEIRALTVGEAVMQLDLQDAPAMMFRNRGNGRLNMVYRRNDGNIGWIDPPDSIV